jgi:hypothetical protein
MPDTLYDGPFISATEVGPRDYEYPFRNNGDVTSSLLSVECWQQQGFYVPQTLSTPHETLTDFYLISETDPARFGFGDIVKFRRTFARIPTQQIEWSSMWVTIPKPSTGIGAKDTIFGYPGGDNSSNAYGGGLLSANWFFGGRTYYQPLKPVTSASFGGNVTTFIVPNHGFDNAASLVAILGNTNTPYIAGVHLINSSWAYTNANAIAGPNGQNFGNFYQFIGQTNVGQFQESGIFVRCRRVTDFYLPGVSAGISSPLDIVLPTDDGNSTTFIDKLLARTGDVTIQVGELTRWRGSPIYSITKTVLSIADMI